MDAPHQHRSCELRKALAKQSFEAPPEPLPFIAQRWRRSGEESPLLLVHRCGGFIVRHAGMLANLSDQTRVWRGDRFTAAEPDFPGRGLAAVEGLLPREHQDCEAAFPEATACNDQGEIDPADPGLVLKQRELV